MSSKCLVVAMAVSAMALGSTQGSATSRSEVALELRDLDKLRREVVLVRELTQDLQARHGQARRLSFQYNEMITRLLTLEADIADHIHYSNTQPDWVLIGE